MTPQDKERLKKMYLFAKDDSVKRYLNAVKWLLFKWVNRRSQKRSYTIKSFFNGLLRSCPLLEPHIKVSLQYR